MPQTEKNNEKTTGDTNSATATATAKVSNGEVSEVALNNPGSGYISAPNVTLTGGGGSGALVTAKVSPQGEVSGLALINKGRRYQSAPEVTISLDGGPALLTYGILTNPDPLVVPQSNTQYSLLTLNVSNSGVAIVDCAAITVTLPGPGQLAQYLTNSFSGIGVQAPSDGDGKPLWTVSQNQGAFTLTPIGDTAGQIGAEGISFTFDNILVNNQPGACTVNIAETASSSNVPSGIRNAPPIVLQKWPPQFSISGPTAKPLQVLYNGSTEIAWSVRGEGVTTSLIYDPDGRGNQTFSVDNVGSKQATNLTSSSGVIFTLQVSLVVHGQSQPLISQEQVIVSILPNPTVDFTIAANPVTLGEPITFKLSWATVDVATFQITANDGPGGNTYTLPVPFSPSGTWTVTPQTLNVTYTFQVLSTSQVEGAKENK